MNTNQPKPIRALVALLILFVGLCAFAHGQTPAIDAATVTLSGSAATTENIVKAIEPGWNWTLINSVLIGIVVVSRAVLKYFLPANPAPGSLTAKLASFLSHTGGVIT